MIGVDLHHEEDPFMLVRTKKDFGCHGGSRLTVPKGRC